MQDLQPCSFKKMDIDGNHQARPIIPVLDARISLQPVQVLEFLLWDPLEEEN